MLEQTQVKFFSDIKARIDKISWKPCSKCGEEWTSRSLNWLNLCPRCHSKEMGTLSKDEQLSEILHEYWNTTEGKEWNGAFNTLPGFMRKKIFEIYKSGNQEQEIREVI